MMLTRISHKKFTVIADMLVTTALSSKNVLNASGTFPRIFLRMPCINRHLHNLVTIPREKIVLILVRFIKQGLFLFLSFK